MSAGIEVRVYDSDLAPGETCPACKRRIPHPKKESSPVTRPKSYRVPEDERKAHDEVLTEAARYLGTHERPHWEFWTYTYALARALQDPDMQGIGQREAAA